MHITDARTAKRRGDKRDRTRARLVQCASELVAVKGFERTTLNDVAKLAGMTRGAIYGNFASRDDLFLAVAESQWTPVAPTLKPGAPLGQQMRLVSDAVTAALAERTKKSVGAASFIVYALTHEKLRRQIEFKNGVMYETLAKQLSAAVPEAQMPVPALTFVRIAHVLIEGIFSLHALTPGLINEEVIRQAFELLSGSSHEREPPDTM